MDKPRIWYVNVFVSDFEKSLKFYTEQMGLSIARSDPDFGYAAFETEGAGFAINAVGPEQIELVGRHTGIGWGVENLDHSHAQLSLRGVEFTSPPVAQPWGGYMAMLKDPDGNLFYLDQIREH